MSDITWSISCWGGGVMFPARVQFPLGAVVQLRHLAVPEVVK